VNQYQPVIPTRQVCCTSKY